MNESTEDAGRPLRALWDNLVVVVVGGVCLKITGPCLEPPKGITVPGYPPHSGSPIERQLYWSEEQKQTQQRPKDATCDTSKQGSVS